MSPTKRSISLLLITTLLAACGQSNTTRSPDTQTASSSGASVVLPVTVPTTISTVSTVSTPDASLFRKVCHGEYIDATSDVFVARNPAGVITRLVVTPSRMIADMGNKIFDMSASYIGEDIGGEFPWDNAALVARANAQVAQYMHGAKIDANTPAIHCGAYH